MPSSAKKNKVDGKVYIRFLVKEDGEVANIEVIRSLHPDCDAEAIRIIKLMPKWKPGEGSDKIVPAIFMVPIQFKVH